MRAVLLASLLIAVPAAAERIVTDSAGPRSRCRTGSSGCSQLREVRALAAQGYGIVLSTPRPDHAFACASEVGLLQNGGLAARDAPAAVLTPARLESVYGVPVSIEQLASGYIVCAPDLGARQT